MLTQDEQRLARLDAELDDLMTRYERISICVHDSLRRGRVGRGELRRIDTQIEQVAGERKALARAIWDA